MTTPCQIEANRRNAQRSTGPITIAGKQVSRSNACKHGLNGEGIVLTKNVVEVVAARVAFWVEEIGAETEDDRRLAEQIAVEQVRVAQAQKEEMTLVHDQALRAAVGWDKQQDHVASEIAIRLVEQPESVSLELELSTHGCALKVRRWETLIRFLKNGNAWDEDRCELALDLLGVIPALRDPEVNEFGQTAAEQGEFARAEVARLKALQAEWLDDLSALDQERAAAGYAFPNPRIWLIRRYEAGCTRRLNAHLRKVNGRDQPAPAPATATKRTPPAHLLQPPMDLEAYLGDLAASKTPDDAAEPRPDDPAFEQAMAEHEAWVAARAEAIAAELEQERKDRQPQLFEAIRKRYEKS